MKRYADFEYYVEIYKGTIIQDNSLFDSAMREASAFLREITHDRIGEQVTDDIRDAACSVAETWYTAFHMEDDENSAREIKSENTDGYSVSYVTEGKDGESREETARRKMYLAARKYLIHKGLLYAGVE